MSVIKFIPYSYLFFCVCFQGSEEDKAMQEVSFSLLASELCDTSYLRVTLWISVMLSVEELQTLSEIELVMELTNTWSFHKPIRHIYFPAFKQ